MTRKERRDIYQEVTDRIISEVEETGALPWQRPWNAPDGMPRNLKGRPYRGVNIMILAMAGYSDPRWGTYKAIKAAGGNVRKGEHGTRIILWKPVHTDHDPDGEEHDHQYLLLRDYVVFNAQQADGIEPLPVVDADYVEPNEAAEQLIDGYANVPGPPIVYGYRQAAYSPAGDMVYMPDRETFDSTEGFYSTVLHELVHSTGHEKRLDRIEPAIFGSDPYAKEELVAEIGAAMLCGTTGIDNVRGRSGSANYVANWLEKLRGDRKLIVQAAAQAQRAADLIAGETFEKENDEPQAAVVAA